MSQDRVSLLEPDEAASSLRAALRGFTGALTVADAATRSGLALRDAERGLHRLLELYPGNLSATSEGELLFSFPAGLSKLRKEQTRWHRFWEKAGRISKAAGRFLVRAWISVVMIGYALVFLAIAIGLIAASLSGNRDDDRGGKGISGGFEFAYVLFRVVAEALFWTFHPAWTFVPDAQHRADRRGRRSKRDDVPFYQKVNRFVFGPEEPALDPRQREQRMLAEIRRRAGRIGASDVMRVLGVSRAEAEPFLARLMLDYDGEVHVSDEGGITYSFPAVRKTVGDVAEATYTDSLAAKTLPKLTGNPMGSNVLISMLNSFNLLMGLFATAAGLSINDVVRITSGFPPVADGVAWVLGVIPVLFSAAIFALPIGRAMRLPATRRRIASENGRRSVVRQVLQRLSRSPKAQPVVSEAELQEAWRQAAGAAPDPQELVRAIVELGGDADMESGRAQYRFRDLEAELAALEAERRGASPTERDVGEVVFAAEELHSPLHR